MSEIDPLAYRLSDRLRAMESTNEPPYAAEPFDLNRGAIALIIAALQLVEAVRFAVKK